METKKITPEQMATLFEFTQRHFVEYYDLQAELADHLANAIEARWVEQPDLPFDGAVQLEFKKFGIFGFSDIVEQRQNALTKRYYKLVWQEMRTSLSAPLVIGAIAIGILLFYVLPVHPWIYVILLFGFLTASSVRLWRIKKQYRKKLRQTGKKWLLEEIIFNCGGLGVLLYLPIQLANYDMDKEMSQWMAGFMSVLLVTLFIYDYIVLFRLPSRAELHLRKVYPEYAMEN
jgi:hypothetical protein